MRYGHLSKSDEKIHQSRCQCQSQPVQATQPSLHPLLKFQQTIGNRAVGRLIQAKGRFNPPGAAGGRIQRACDECEREARQPEEKDSQSSAHRKVQRQVDEETEEEPAGLAQLQRGVESGSL